MSASCLFTQFLFDISVSALAGVDRLPAAWRAQVATLRGVCVPELQGVSLHDLADRLIGAAEYRSTRAPKPANPPDEVATEAARIHDA